MLLVLCLMQFQKEQDRVALLITDPPPTRFSTWSKNIYPFLRVLVS